MHSRMVVQVAVSMIASSIIVIINPLQSPLSPAAHNTPVQTRMSALFPVSNRMNRTHIATPRQFRINLPELFNSQHSGQRNHTTLVYRRIPIIFQGGDNVVIQPAILISAQQTRIRIPAAIQRFYF